MTDFTNIADDYEKAFFEQFPELGIFWGKKDAPIDRFTDFSPESFINWHGKEDLFLHQLKTIDPKKLSAAEKISYQLLMSSLENNKNTRICREELWDVNPAFGWHNKLTTVAQKQPVGTPELREKALKRWETFPKVVEQQILNLKDGINKGFTAPKPAVERVITQLKIISEGKVEDSPFYDFAKRDGNLEFQQHIKNLIETKINPALHTYISFLQNEYLLRARVEIGTRALPNGVQCYQAKIKQETTLNIPAREIHDLGLSYMKKLNHEVGAIGLKKYNTEDMAEIFRLAKEESTGVFSTEEDIIHYNQEALERVKAKASLWFDLMPKTPGIIHPYPAFRAKTGASGEYNPPSEDGVEPGVFYINTYDPTHRSRIDQEATLFHELIPGHHFQIALQYEDTSIPKLNRYLWNAGYGEGWALYVERLAEEMDVYSDDISRLGMLSNESLRASRLVVDTGIHLMHWTRQQAIDYLTQHTALDKAIIEGEVDRYIMLPGQATSYMLGKLEIEALRQYAKDKLKERFDIRQFHNQVLKNGAITLPMLREQITHWVKHQE